MDIPVATTRTPDHAPAIRRQIPGRSGSREAILDAAHQLLVTRGLAAFDLRFRGAARRYRGVADIPLVAKRGGTRARYASAGVARAGCPDPSSRGSDRRLAILIGVWLCAARDFRRDFAFIKQPKPLSSAEITRVARLFAEEAATKLRITGGEPLPRTRVERTEPG
jgi:hypothetical protein